jgi:pimeloyl-ACP methyl ester carboxylesterase
MTAGELGESGQGGYVRANGLDIYCEEQGQGRPLLLIHGGLLTGASWQPYIAAFAALFRVITPDSRGHGHTANPTGAMSYRLMADDVAALAEALDLRKPLVCGYSDGGQVALEIGMRYPDLPQALVIGGAYSELTEASRRWVRSILGDSETPEVDPAQFERDNAKWAATLRQIHGPENWKALLTQIKPLWNATLNYTADDFLQVVAPTLLLIGDRDGFVPVEDAVTMYRLLPHAELAVLPGSDHTDFIFSHEKVALLLPLMLDFLLRQGDTGDGIPPGHGMS